MLANTVPADHRSRLREYTFNFLPMNGASELELCKLMFLVHQGVYYCQEHDEGHT